LSSSGSSLFSYVLLSTILRPEIVWGNYNDFWSFNKVKPEISGYINQKGTGISTPFSSH
jgi:hypothetical protein